MRRTFLPLIILVIALGCLYKAPYSIKASVEGNAVTQGGLFYIIVDFNNTGKVAFVGMEDLSQIPDGFAVLQEPQFPKLLKVGESVQLVWMIRAPPAPGTYPIKLRLNFVDELNRKWFEYHEFLITVVAPNPPSSPEPKEGYLTVRLSSPGEVRGGEEFEVEVSLSNEGEGGVRVEGMSLHLPEGLKVIRSPVFPLEIAPRENRIVAYTVRAPYSTLAGYLTLVVSYDEGNGMEKKPLSTPITVVWRPWKNEGALEEAYGENYRWITNPYVVDAYWARRYNADLVGDVGSLRNVALPIVGNASSEVEAGERLYGWIRENYVLEDNTTAVDPVKVLPQRKISYSEASILFVGLMKAVNVPARLVTLYDGEDCTARPVAEFYAGGKWYIVDFERDFFGELGDYMAGPYFPRLYQLLEEGYMAVSFNTKTLAGHEHVDVSVHLTESVEEVILEKVRGRLTPNSRLQFEKVINSLNDEDRLFALFLFASAPREELNYVLSHYPTGDLVKSVEVIHEFYKGKPYPEDFRKYWNVLKGGLG